MKLFALFLSLLLSSFNAMAQNEVQEPAPYLTGGVGVFDVSNGESAVQFLAEYRAKPLFHQLRPLVGASINTDGGRFLYGGLNYTMELHDRWHLTPSLAAGYYHQGESTDLGHDLQFRSALEGSYTLNSGARIGLQLDHMSNAGRGKRNPGVESLMLLYSHPVIW